ncbi:sugar ABC transporter permease [Candidatus Borkfalkia ceftriaxoniphila]|jgi:transmembrane permease msmF|uniref:Sugar ABC transporter permease n=1 Tax=Candidatus Borkfalkia ceftriaxoniphila TaxID=2508949 RepID=A0A4Q2KE40_9FIRM|nr:sugar ABC transporter permease [Candidatus Borkfalkia ceftriaxoniphila]RXZ62257.1 sugar ABC transporter permease [Candidatus Borkfalkia ceftriaxoniphila]
MISVTLKKRIRGSVSGWLFVLPMTVGICVFTLVPIVQSFYYSFFNYDVVSVFDFVGFGNYIKVFTESEMSKVVTNTLFFAAVNIPVVMCGSYLLALFLNVNVKGIKVFRVLYYLPCVMPAIVGGIVWSYLMRDNPETPGIFNQFLISLGLSSSAFFNAENLTAILSIVLMNLWSLGGGTIIWLAQFKNIPKQLYEAAEMDGAGAGRKFFSITLPMSTPMIFYNLITTFIVTLQFNGTLTFAPNGGRGNDKATYMFGLKIYHEAFRRYNMGYACALAWVLVVAVGLLTGLVFKTNKWVQYDS